MNPYSNCPQSERIEDEQVNVEICYVYVPPGCATAAPLINRSSGCTTGFPVDQPDNKFAH